jgi:putative transposase
LCARFGVSRSGYYAWKKRPKPTEPHRDCGLLKEIRKVHKGRKRAYGSPRVYHELKSRGIECSRRRVARIMRENGIKASVVGLYRAAPGCDEKYHQSANILAKTPKPTGPGQQWVADFTYIKTKRGSCYFATVLDRYSRKLVGWSFSKKRNAKLVSNALNMAVLRESPSEGLIFHSDRGIEYVADSFQQQLRSFGFVSSMSGKGRCLDNAMAESFFHTLKTELVYQKFYSSPRYVEKDIQNYVSFYNNERLHSSLGYLSPKDYLRTSA